MGCGSSGADQGPTLNMESQQRNATNNAVKQIQSSFSGFTPNFYQGIAQAYQNQAWPQLAQQQRQAQNQVGFTMANQGLLKSSQNQQANQAIQDQSNVAKTQIAQQGQGLVQQQQQQVANQEGNLIGMAQTANNPGQLAATAGATASSLQAPSTFAPIGQFFNSILSQYAGGQQQNLGNSLLTGLQSLYTNPLSFASGGVGQ